MYGYYAATTTGWRNRAVAFFITIGQIAQMVVGVGLLAYKTANCDIVYTANVAFGWVIYGSYLVLFVNYFVGRYFKKKADKKKGD